MKKALIIAGLLTLGVSAHAQPGQGRQKQDQQGPPTQEMINKAGEELGLSDEQLIEWKKVHAAMASELRGIKNPRSKEALEAQEKFEEDLAAILTEEQLKKFNKMKKGRQGRPPRGEGSKK